MHARLAADAAARRIPRLLPRRRGRLRVPEAEARAAAGGGARRRTISLPTASWSAIAGATSRPAAAPAARTIFIDYGYDERRPEAAGRGRAVAARSRRLDPVAVTERGFMKSVDQLSVKIFADGADLAGMLEMYRQAVHQGVHDQSDADAQGRHHRLPRPSRSEVLAGDSRPADLVRGVLRRVRRDGAPGARDRQLGRERLREDSGHQHAAASPRATWSGGCRTPASS